ncbi:hypothetical protein PQI23_06910 [Leucobacter sp. USCH14]|uniref:hypothetical protein n=1 Tax=Leucobacter sp. USCH14 TaxID=3024838 RepID=UPI003096DCA9
MSTEHRARRRTLASRIAVFAILGALAAGLAGANLVQPPRLSGVDANSSLLVSRTDQRVQLHFSQPIEPVDPESVVVTPETPIDITSEGSALTIRFLEMLDTGTEYRIEAQVHGAATGSSDAVTASVRTPDPATYTLSRSADGDRLLEHRLHDASSTRTVFSAPSIEEYSSTSTGLAVVSRDDSGLAALAIHSEATGGEGSGGFTDPDPFRIMSAPHLSQLRSDANSGVLGVVASGAGDDGTEYDRTLLVIDPATVIVSTVADADGSALPVRDWRFIPGTTSIVFQSPDGRLHGWEAAPEPRVFELGVSGELLGFIPGTTTLAISESSGPSLVDLSGAVTGTLDGSPPRAPIASPAGADGRALLALAPDAALARTGLAVEAFASSGGVDTRAAGSPLGDGSLVVGGAVLVRNGEETRTIFTPAAESTRIGRICLSPNAEFAAIETVSADGESDGVEAAPGYSQTTTNYVRVDSGETVRSAIGGLSDWCG